MKNILNINNESIISICPVESSHDNFLVQVFKECRPDLAFIYNIDEKFREDIILQQFKIEQEQLMKIYPDAEFNIIMFNEKPIGRIYVHYGKKINYIIEIGLIEEYRGLGIGRRIITEIIEDAKEKDKAVHLQVAWFNQSAHAFYKKLGFKFIEDNLVFCKMQYMK